MEFIKIPWMSVGSKNNLAATCDPKKVFNQLVTVDANEWGFFKLPNGKLLVVGYAALGLVPQGIISNGNFLMGIDEVLSSFDVNTLGDKFSYRMPSIFHEFVSLDELIVVRDEVGFVAISDGGVEVWKFLTNGPINEFFIESGKIYGNTIDGEQFNFSVPS